MSENGVAAVESPATPDAEPESPLPAEPAAVPPPQLIEVAFKGNRREFFLWSRDTVPPLRTPVIVEVERGEDFARVHATGEHAARRKAGTTHGKNAPDPLRKVLRVATPDDVIRSNQLRSDEDNVRRRAIEKVRSQGLEMKVSDTEWQWDKKKLTIYFTAEKRVDFRQLVRQLEGLFGTRVQMWHIGVRDEAKRVDGVGRCGRQFCSAGWLPELRPVKSSVAKDQRLSTLNPAQISGSCGRLMCCLRHEHEFYVQQRKRFPKEGKVLVTLAGEEKVVSNDIFRERVVLRAASGETRTVSLVALQAELGGGPIGAPTEPKARSSEHPAEARVEPPAEPVFEGEEGGEGGREEEREEEREVLVEIERAPPRSASETEQRAGAIAGPDLSPPPPPREARPRRRRRGRRGGRRGKDGGGPRGDPPGGTPPSGTPPASGPPAPPAPGS